MGESEPPDEWLKHIKEYVCSPPAASPSFLSSTVLVSETLSGEFASCDYSVDVPHPQEIGEDCDVNLMGVRLRVRLTSKGDDGVLVDAHGRELREQCSLEDVERHERRRLADDWEMGLINVFVHAPEPDGSDLNGEATLKDPMGRSQVIPYTRNTCVHHLVTRFVQQRPGFDLDQIAVIKSGRVLPLWPRVGEGGGRTPVFHLVFRMIGSMAPRHFSTHSVKVGSLIIAPKCTHALSAGAFHQHRLRWGKIDFYLNSESAPPYFFPPLSERILLCDLPQLAGRTEGEIHWLLRCASPSSLVWSWENHLEWPEMFRHAVLSVFLIEWGGDGGRGDRLPSEVSGTTFL